MEGTASEQRHEGASGASARPPLTHDEVEAIEGSPIAVTPETAPAKPGVSRLGPLRHAHFRNVWLGALVVSVGNWMEQIGVQWVVAHESAKPTIAMGWLTAAHLGPICVFGLYGGLVADRVNRKKLLVVTQAILMVIAASIAVLSYYSPFSPGFPLERWVPEGMRSVVPEAVRHMMLDTPTALIALMAAYGVTAAFNIPAWHTLTPRLVPREELTEAIALNGLQFNIARVIGPAIAGALLAQWGPTVLFAINAASFVGVLCAFITTPDSPAPPRTGESFWGQTLEALRFTFHERGPRAVFWAMVVFSFAAVPLLRMLPIFMSDVFVTAARAGIEDHEALLAAQQRGFGIMTAVMGAGAVSGVLLLRRVPRWYPKHHLIPLSILICGIAMVVFCATSNVWVAYVAMFAIGLFWLWTYNLGFSAVQLLVTDSMRGRALAVLNTAAFGAMPIGSIVAGYLGEYAAGADDHGASAQIGVGVMGALLGLVGVVMLIWRTPEVDGLKPGDPGYDRAPGFIRGLTASAHRPRAGE